MHSHSIVSFFGPGLAMCGRCERVVDVYQWSEPCERLAPVDDDDTTPEAREAAVLVSC